MRRFGTMLGAALVSFGVCAAFVPAPAQAQVIAVQMTRSYTPVVVRPNFLPPVYVNPPGMVNTYPLIAPSYASTLNLYPQVPVTYSYFAPPAAVLTPVVPVAVPAPGVYSAGYSYSSGFGFFRPRYSYSQVYIVP